MVMGDTKQKSASTGDVLMTPAEVAALFRVSPKTVARWSRAGKLTAIRTLGGHRRFRIEEVRALRAEVDQRFVDDVVINVDEETESQKRTGRRSFLKIRTVTIAFRDGQRSCGHGNPCPHWAFR